MNSRLQALLLVILVVGVTTGPTVGATYDVEIQGAIDVPARTVTFQGSEYTISAIGRADPGDDLSIQTTAPAGNDYRVYLYTSDKQIVADPRASGSSSVTISLEGLQPGTYMVTLYDGEYRAVQPVVIRGYSVQAASPREATRGDEITVSVDVAGRAASGQPAGVEVVIANADQTIRTTATHDSGGHYTTGVSLAGIDAGAYQVYAVAQGTESVFGHTELLGMSASHPLSVTKAKSGSGDGPGSGSQPTTAITTSPPSTTVAEQPTPSSSTRTTRPAPSQTTPATTTTQFPTDPSTTTENVITPSPPTSTPTQTTPGQDGDPVLAIFALVIASVWYGRRGT